MKVVVFGAGYVGLVQAAVLAEIGHHVVCVDVNVERVADLNKGIIPIYEPGLSALIKQCVSEGNLSFTLDKCLALQGAEVVFIAVGTPPDEDGSADLRYVKQVAKDVAENLFAPAVLVTKSTVPVTTGDQLDALIKPILEKRDTLPCSPDKFITVVSNPEFLKEGAALTDCRRPDRIIVGTDNAHAVDVLKALYAPLNRNHDKIIVMGRRDAEFTKYAANCMLATKISFINEMSQIAMKMGVDIESVRKGIGSDPRIGHHFIYPGCGYGGSCFPKDVSALIKSSQQAGVEPELLVAVEQVNARQKRFLPNTVSRVLGHDLRGVTLAIWGLSFKPNTDDMREAPSRVLIDFAINAGATLQMFDPEAIAETKRIYGSHPQIRYMGNKEQCLEDASALVICTEWKAFQVPDLVQLKSSLKTPVVIDGRNLYDPQTMKQAGFLYYAVGRGESIAI